MHEFPASLIDQQLENDFLVQLLSHPSIFYRDLQWPVPLEFFTDAKCRGILGRLNATEPESLSAEEVEERFAAVARDSQIDLLDTVKSPDRLAQRLHSLRDLARRRKLVSYLDQSREEVINARRSQPAIL